MITGNINSSHSSTLNYQFGDTNSPLRNKNVDNIFSCNVIRDIIVMMIMIMIMILVMIMIK